eukprot:jgi/Galph1/1038/GphlegSOOS_G5854.1
MTYPGPFQGVAPTKQLQRKLDREKQALPAYQAKNSFIQALNSSEVVLVVGDTGCGKTTQFPQQAVDEGYSYVAVTQPRRVAAISVATRVALERNECIGKQVGYAVRFDDKTCSETSLRYVTDGVLLREAMNDPLLSRYNVIFIDEAHERALQTDVILGVTKRALSKRRDSLKLVIMSAFFDVEKLRNYFSSFCSSLLEVPGRMFPIEVFYTKDPVEDYLEAAVVTCLQLHFEESFPGDILIFLTGQEEIEVACRLLQERLDACYKQLVLFQKGLDSTDVIDSKYRLVLFPLFSALSPDAQMAALEPSLKRFRKAILATNIAETSLTIPGIKYVIDCGFSKQRMVSSRTGLDTLRVAPISQAQALQRAGRAGREMPGCCYRLYTKRDFQKLPLHPVPEILVGDLVTITLQLMAMGIENPLDFDLLDHPKSESFQHAFEVLLSIGALDVSMKLSKLGKQMAFFPLSPMLSRSLLESALLDCSNAMLALCSVLSTESMILQFSSQKREQKQKIWNKFVSPYGDHISLLYIFQTYLSVAPNHRFQWCKEHFLNYRSLSTAENIYKQLRQLFTQFQQRYPPPTFSGHIQEEEVDRLGRCLVSGFFRQSASIGRDGRLVTLFDAMQVDIHPSSVLHRRCQSMEHGYVIYHELIWTSKPYIRTVMLVKEEWLLQHGGDCFQIES